MSKDKTTEKPNSEKNEEVVEGNQPYSVKKIDNETYSVVSENGEIVRTYKEEEGCEDPKECAKMFAKKLSMKKI